MELPVWHKAADFAARKHAAQWRKDEVTPYICHPMRVALIVNQVFGCTDPEVTAVALLHDVLEDTPTDYEDLAEPFGTWVADAVATLSDNKCLPCDHRREEYHDRLRTADWRVLLVKLADAYDNISDATVNPDPAFRDKTFAKAKRLLELARAREADHALLRSALACTSQLLEVATQRRVSGRLASDS